ncbi:glycerol-3-phosphate acyltransferase [Clostridium sp. 'deep sea']|uniref:glycerol-3-phosphate acyltransferase n=1 Tax=Clostridium sp. 'deep sea' TaxID=2779445 RepID=UPI00189640EA|nr:glycerol-3-phosphate acyltransferase [Clostridium sp. 'deep sea']QOR34078.1 glycerol-3-phosphate acyltransferase [Clostridium sp. 'deep sea']
MLNIFLSTLIGYIFGCFQSSYILGKLFKNIDIREHGVNNAGASNTVIVLGWKFGAIVGLLDILKGFLAVFIAKLLWPDLTIVWFAAGAGAFIGHCYPFFMNFRGGKGTATFIGMTFGISPFIGLICLLSIVITALISDYIFIGTLAILPMFCFLIIFYDYSIFAISITILMISISMYRHRLNFVRLYRGQESHISSFLKK